MTMRVVRSRLQKEVDVSKAAQAAVQRELEEYKMREGKLKAEMTAERKRMEDTLFATSGAKVLSKSSLLQAL